MMRLYRFFLWLVIMTSGFVSSYSPTTWICGEPNNLYAPLCLANVLGKKDKSLSLQGNIRTNLFAFAQTGNYIYIPCLMEGIALQGDVHMNRLLHGLYSQIYISALLNREKTYNSASHANRYSTSASIAEIPCIVGWNVIEEPQKHFASFVFGVIPTTKKLFLYHSKIIQLTGLDDHFVWGLGIEGALRLIEKPRWHIDWLADSDITFLENRKSLVFSEDNEGDKPILVAFNARQLYKGRTAFLYQYKHFTSDVGIQCFYMTSQKYRVSDQNITVKHAATWLSFFCDIGLVAHFFKFPSYITLGTQTTKNYCGFN